MKNYIYIILFFVLALELKSQGSNNIYIFNNYLAVYQDRTLPIDSLYSQADIASAELRNLFFENDSLLIFKFDSFIHFLHSSFAELGFVVTEPHIRLFNAFDQYKRSIKYKNLSGYQLLDSLLYHDADIFLLFSDIIDSSYIDYRFSKLMTNNEEFYQGIIEILLSTFYINGDETPLMTKYIKQARSNPTIYCEVLDFLRIKYHFPGRFYFLELEQKFFEDSMDLNDSKINNTYNYCILNKLSPGEMEEKEYWDKIQKRDDSLNDIRLKEMREEWLVEDSIRKVKHIKNLTGQDKIWYLISQDTTLYREDQNGRVVDMGDDGFRFDTLSTAEILAYWIQINMDSLYTSMHTETDLNTSTDIVNLRKITQIIGDRNMYGLLVHTTALDTQIYKFMSYMQKVKDEKLFSPLYSELKMDCMRLWTLGKPYYLKWATENFDQYAIIYVGFLHAMLTEDEVKSMVQKADSLLIAGNKNKARDILSLLTPIAEEKKVNLLTYPPRRKPIRSVDDSVRWCDEFLVDILFRAGFIQR